MKTTKKHFKTFERSCRYWQECFELSHWRITFVHTRMHDCYAKTSTDSHNCLATIELTTRWDNRIPLSSLELNRVARHELIHIINAGLLGAACDRHASKDEIMLESEHATRRLEAIIEKLSPIVGVI